MLSLCHFLRLSQLSQLSYLSLFLTLPTVAYGSPEMAIERAAAQMAEQVAAGRPVDVVLVPVHEAIPAMLRPGCRLALDKPRPADFSQALPEDEAELSQCVAVMQSAMTWQDDSFAACPPAGITFVRAQACESAATVFLLHHTTETEQTTEARMALQMLHDVCAPSVLCPSQTSS